MRKPNTSRFLGVLVVVLLLVLTLGSGCSGPVVEAEIPDEPVVPKNGKWIGATIDIHLNDEEVQELTLKGIGCVGNITPDGIPLCSSLLDGDWTLPSPLASEDGEWEIETPFGLDLKGHYIDADRLTGTYTYISDDGCCASQGNWAALHEDRAASEPVAPCHKRTEEESFSLHPSELNGSDQLSPALQNFDILEITPGFQGGVMILLSLQTMGFSMGGDVGLEVLLDLPDQGVTGLALGDGTLLVGDQEAALWDPVWLILSHTSSNDLLTGDDAFELVDQDANLTIRITNSCGFLWNKTFSVRLHYEF